MFSVEGLGFKVQALASSRPVPKKAEATPGWVTLGSMSAYAPEGEFFSDNLLVRIHFIILMIGWTGLAPWEFEFPFPGSLTSLVLAPVQNPPG